MDFLKTCLYFEIFENEPIAFGDWTELTKEVCNSAFERLSKSYDLIEIYNKTATEIVNKDESDIDKLFVTNLSKKDQDFVVEIVNKWELDVMKSLKINVLNFPLFSEKIKKILGGESN